MIKVVCISEAVDSLTRGKIYSVRNTFNNRNWIALENDKGIEQGYMIDRDVIIVHEGAVDSKAVIDMKLSFIEAVYKAGGDTETAAGDSMLHKSLGEIIDILAPNGVRFVHNPIQPNTPSDVDW